MPEIEVLSENALRPGALVFDIGAHQCVVAMVMARTVSPGGTVVAVEASGHSVAVAGRNRSLNSVENLEVLHAAIAREPGTLRFSELGHRVQTDPGGLAVPAVTIDALAEAHGRPDVVYLDVEGFEGEALLGAERTLDARPDWMVEVHTGAGLESFGGSVELVLDHFESRGYRLLVAPEVGLFLPIEEGRHLLAQRFMLIALAG